MSINIQPRMPNFDPGLGGSEAASAMAVILELNNKKVKIRRSRIRDLVSGLAEIAYDLGETNDPDQFANEMTDVIFGAYKKVAQKRKRN